jgi:hypothetical protein
MLGIVVELALVVHDHIEVTFKEGGRSWWIFYVGFAGSLARPGAFVVVVVSIEVMHYRVLSVDQFVDVGHEVANGFGIGFMDILEQLDVSDPLLVVCNDVVVFDTCEDVAVVEVVVGVLTESFVSSHPYSSEVVSIARTIVGPLVIGYKSVGQGRLGGDALCWEIVEPYEWRLTHHEGKVSSHVVFIASPGTRGYTAHLEPYTRVRATIVLLN